MTSDTSAQPFSGPPEANVPPAEGNVQPPGQPAAIPIRWPEWFRAFDLGLAVAGVVLAFLLASFVARNADLWRHLAAGRLVAQFTYPYGGDPFTYTAANRVWVNANWLSELAFYALYSIDSSGAVLVTVKAMAFAATFATLMLLRRPQFSLWPWAFAITLGALGACIQAQMRPFVFGLVLNAIVLVVLFRGDWTSRKWKMPLILGGVVALWANVDGFAFLGPLTVGLLFAGELIQDRLLKVTNLTPADADPFPPVPPTPALARALLVTCVALILNPTFLAGVVRDPAGALVQLVPVECDFGVKAALQPDKDLVRGTYSVTSTGYFTNAIYGKNVSGVVTILVAVMTVVLSVVGYRHGRVSHMLVWVGTALLPVIFHARFVGVFFLVSVPLLAAHLNAFARRASVISANHPSARPFGFVARFGRLFSVLALASLIAMAVPGWLHPNFDLRALDRWVAWSVEPDEGMKRAGELIQGWRTDGTKGPLLAGVNGVLTHPDFGDYAAWYAPAEKPFLNSRYRLHRAELDDLIELRRWLIYRKPAEDSPRLTAILEKNSAEYVCLGQSMLNVPYLGVTAALDEFRSKESSAGGASGWDGLWHLDGRFAVVGRFDTTARIERSAALVWNVARNAFGPRDRVAVEEDAVIHVGEPPRVGWEHEFVLRPPLPPVELSDSTSYSLFSQVRQQVAVQMWQQRVEEWRGGTVRGLWLVGGGPLALQANLASPRAPEPQDIDFALPILAVQSARRAIQRDPDEPRGYNALSLAYTLEMLPQLQPGENRIQILTALTRAHARMPEPVEGERTRSTAAGIEIEARLFKYHLMADVMQDQHVDLARAAVVNLSKLVRAANDEDLRYNPVFELWNIWIGVLRVELATRAQVPLENLPPTEQLLDVLVQQKMLDATDHPKQWQLKDETDVTREFVLDRLKKLETAVLEAIRRRNDIVERQSPETRFRNFIRFGLPGKAIEMFDGKQAKKENVTLEELQEYIGLLFAVGRLEQATDYRKKLEETVAKMADATDPRAPAIRQTHQHFELTEAKLAGNFKRAEMLLEEQFRSVAPPKLTPAERAKLTLDTTSFALSIGALSGGWNCTFAYSEIALLKQRLYLESTFLFQRGMMALLNGDTALAKTHFDAASRPQGVDLKAIGIPQDMPALPMYLPKYRELLDRYGTKR